MFLENDEKRGLENPNGQEELEGCNCESGCCDDGCECDHDHIGHGTVTMVDENGEEYTFSILDNFNFGDDQYCVLVTDEDEPEMVITKLIVDEDGSVNLMSLSEEESDVVYAEYERICEEADYEDEDSEE